MQNAGIVFNLYLDYGSPQRKTQLQFRMPMRFKISVWGFIQATFIRSNRKSRCPMLRQLIMIVSHIHNISLHIRSSFPRPPFVNRNKALFEKSNCHRKSTVYRKRQDRALCQSNASSEANAPLAVGRAKYSISPYLYLFIIAQVLCFFNIAFSGGDHPFLAIFAVPGAMLHPTFAAESVRPMEEVAFRCFASAGKARRPLAYGPQGSTVRAGRRAAARG